MTDGSAAQTCPQCGGDSQCALPAGAASAAECWCSEVVMDTGRLAAWRDKAQCLCRLCAGTGNDTRTLRS